MYFLLFSHFSQMLTFPIKNFIFTKTANPLQMFTFTYKQIYYAIPLLLLWVWVRFFLGIFLPFYIFSILEDIFLQSSLQKLTFFLNPSWKLILIIAFYFDLSKSKFCKRNFKKKFTKILLLFYYLIKQVNSDYVWIILIPVHLSD